MAYHQCYDNCVQQAAHFTKISASSAFIRHTNDGVHARVLQPIQEGPVNLA